MFWEELIAYFPFMQHGLHRKRRLQQYFYTAGMCIPNCCLATIPGYTDRTTDFPFIRHGPRRKLRFQQFFVTAGTCLPNRDTQREPQTFFDMTRTTQKKTRPTILLLLLLIVAQGTCHKCTLFLAYHAIFMSVCKYLNV
jgi:hypothetical protein